MHRLGLTGTEIECRDDFKCLNTELRSLNWSFGHHKAFQMTNPKFEYYLHVSNQRFALTC